MSSLGGKSSLVMDGGRDSFEEGDESRGEEMGGYRTRWDEVMAQMGKINVNGKKGRQKMREAVQLVLGEVSGAGRSEATT